MTHSIWPAIWVELLKARRSKMPLLTALGFAMAPLAGGFFMIVLKDPELALRVGLISAKAQIMAGTADWPTFLGLLAQAAAIGGIFLFSLIGSWVFGREFVDHTAKDLLALPTPRAVIVLAKFVVVGLWSAGLTVFVYLLGLAVGLAVGLPPATGEIIWQGTWTLIVSTSLTITLVTPIAFFASAGRSYLPPVSAAIVAVILAQLVAAAGWGEFFPWSVPALLAGLAGPQAGNLGTISYLIVLLTSLAGLAATFSWWEMADHAG